MTIFKIQISRLLPLLFCLLTSFVATPAQQKPEPTPEPQKDEDVLRISTALVQTDVTVVDKQGRFVNDLKPEQFELKVDGKPQPISFFELVTAGSPKEIEQLAAMRGAAAITSGSSISAVQRGRSIIFFIDDMHMSAESVLRVRKVLLRFIDTAMAKDDLIAIVAATGSVGFLQQFTNNKSVLRAAISRLSHGSYSAEDTQRPSMTEFQAMAVDRGEPDVIETYVQPLLIENPRLSRDMAESMVRQRASQIIKQSALITIRMLGALDNLLSNSIRLPGRKLAYFLSDGFLVETRSSDSLNRLRRVTTTAARAGVVIYTLDARGLVTEFTDPTQQETFDPFGRHARQTQTAKISHTHDSLVMLAEHTGGRVYLNSNALDTGLRRALDEISQYYVLAWRPDPENNREGKFRDLEVKVVGRSDLKVRARRGFYTDEGKAVSKGSSSKPAAVPTAEPDPAKAADDELRAAMSSMVPRKGLPTHLAVNYLDMPDKVSMLTVAMKIPGDALTYEKVADKFSATVGVFGGVFDDKGQPVSNFKDELKVTANSTEPAALRNQKVIYTSQAAVKPGLYQVRIATRDAGSKRTGSATEWIEVPDLTKGSLATSGIFVSELKAGQNQTDEEALKLTNSSVDRRFAKSSKLLFLTYIYNAARGPGGTGAPDVGIQVQVLSDTKPVLKTKMMKVSTEDLSDPARIPYSAAIPLSAMPAGRYTLEITVTDIQPKTTATQRLNFEIE